MDLLVFLIVVGLLSSGFHFIGKQDWKHAIIGSFVSIFVLFFLAVLGMVLVQHREAYYR